MYDILEGFLTRLHQNAITDNVNLNGSARMMKQSLDLQSVRNRVDCDEGWSKAGVERVMYA